MAKDPVSDDLMMRYLLGDVSDQEQVRLEEHYFGDDGVFEQMSALEDELIDDYVRGELGEPQRKQFELHFLNSAERRRKLAFAEAFTRYLSKAPVVAPAAKPETWRERITEWLGLRGAPARWAFAATFAAVLLGGLWLVQENWRLRTQLRQMQAKQTELRQREEQLSRQLAQLQLPPIEGAPVPDGARSQPRSLPIVALTLVPGVLRSSAEQKTLIIPPGPHLVRLQLDLDKQTYDSYLASLETAEGIRVWSKEGLETMPERGGSTVVLKLPSSLLNNKDYILKLRGVRSGGVADEIAAYGFRVVKH